MLNLDKYDNVCMKSGEQIKYGENGLGMKNCYVSEDDVWLIIIKYSP